MVFIYCIEDINDLKYVGSTKQDLNRRFLDHRAKQDCSASKLNLYNAIIYVLEECSEEDRKERERYWIDKIDCVNIYKLDKHETSHRNKYVLERYYRNRDEINARRRELYKLKKEELKK